MNKYNLQYIIIGVAVAIALGGTVQLYKEYLTQSIWLPEQTETAK